MFKIGDRVDAADDRWGKLIRSVFDRERIELPAVVEDIGINGGPRVVGDCVCRNRQCFKLAEPMGGPW